MYAYISSYLVLLTFCFLYLFLEAKESNAISIKAFFITGLIPAIFFVVFRGNVGTDTGSYLQVIEYIIFDSFGDTGDIDIEIGFYLLLKGLIFLFSEPRFVVNAISFFITIYCFYLFSCDRIRFLIFTLLIFPLFFFDMTMNGLRYALSFLLAKHAADEYAINKRLKSLILLICCVGFQLSGVLVFFLLRVRQFKILTLIYTFIFGCIFYALFQERLIYKYAAYADLESPSIFSGLLPLIIFFACYICLILVDRRFAKKFMLLFVLEVASFVLAKFTYAGLRFQLLLLFVFFCFISEIDLKAYGKNKILVLSLFFLIGFVGFSGTLRHYINDAAMPPSPFLPYHFYWDIQ